MAGNLIQILRRDYLFDNLRYGSQFDGLETGVEDEGEEWKSTPVRKKATKIFIAGEPAELALPLEQVALYLYREGRYYSGKIQVTQQGEFHFNGLSKLLKMELLPLVFRPIRRYGLGYIFDPSSKESLPEFTIRMQDGKFEIGMGDSGSRPRVLTDKGSMELDFNNLEHISSTLIRGCYKLVGKSTRGLPEVIPLTS